MSCSCTLPISCCASCPANRQQYSTHELIVPLEVDPQVDYAIDRWFAENQPITGRKVYISTRNRT